MKSCDYDEDKPKMPEKKGTGPKDKPAMKKGGKGGEKLGHAVHHKNMPHGHKGPKSPEGY